MPVLITLLLGLVYLVLLMVLIIAIRVTILSRPTKGKQIEEYQNPRKALLVIDIQEDYTGETAEPPFPYPNAANFIAKVNEIIETAVKKDILIVYIGQESPNNLYYRLIGAGRTLVGQP